MKRAALGIAVVLFMTAPGYAQQVKLIGEFRS